MKKYFLTEIITKDNVIHQGLYFEPKIKSDTAILWVHGLSSTFYSRIPAYDALTDLLEKKGFGFAAFNNRGHDVITGPKKRDVTKNSGYTRIAGGAGQEIFEDCIYDIDAGITFLQKQGYRKIVLAGHSTGANKVCYYIYKIDDTRVSGVILAGPTSDRHGLGHRVPWFVYSFMKFCVAVGFGSHLFQTKESGFPITPKRFLSMLGRNSNEDVFNYGDKQIQLTAFQSIIKPLLIIMGENDEYAHIPVKDIEKIYDAYQKSSHYQSVIIPNSAHGYEGKEKELATCIIKWMEKI